jgi:ABC-type transport system substrate-binding protein
VLRIGTSSALIAALHRGDLQAVVLQPGAADQETLNEQVPVARRVAVPLPGTVQLVLNTLSGATSDLGVRRAIAAALDTTALRSALDGGNPAGGSAVRSFVSLGGTGAAGAGDMPGPGGDLPGALADLAAAGYHRESLYMSKSGAILRLTLTYSSLDAGMAAAAQLVQRQLAAVGIEIDLIREDPRTMVNARMAAGLGDLGLVMVPRGPSDALAAGSAFGCPLRPAGQKSTSTTALPRAGNLSGLCLADLQTLLGQAASGWGVGPVDPVVSAAVPVVPISRPSAIFAVSAGLASIAAGAGPGWVFSGPLWGLPRWPAR